MATTAKSVKERRRRRSSGSGTATGAGKCGRPRAYLRKFALCRLCFRELALRGEVAGVIKSSW